MSAMYDKLEWRKKPNAKYSCFDDGVLLGYLKKTFVSNRREWCWFQAEKVYLKPGQLNEIRAKQKRLWGSV